MAILDPKKSDIAYFHKFMLGTIAPRPIAFASTIDAEGMVNLSPFSFFNCFSANPPVLIFSPSRRVRDNTIKHTLENVYEVKEVVINVVNYSIVEQASLASTEYEKGVNEFLKAGLTPVPSVKVKPPRVKESPVAYECKVLEIIPLGTGHGAGNLIVCEVLLAHYDENILAPGGKIDPHMLDLVARMGDDFYCRASGQAIFEVPKPNMKKGIGVDQMPAKIRESRILTGNNLGRLGNIERLPSPEEIISIRSAAEVNEILQEKDDSLRWEKQELLAKRWIEEGKTEDAWKILLL